MRKLFLSILLTLAVHNLVAQSMEWLCHPGKFSDIQYMGYNLFKVKNNAGKWGIFSADGNYLYKSAFLFSYTFSKWHCHSVTHPKQEKQELHINKKEKK